MHHSLLLSKIKRTSGIAIAMVILCIVHISQATLLFEEGFNYTAGANLSGNGSWAGTSSTNQSIVGTNLFLASIKGTTPAGNALQISGGASRNNYRNFSTNRILPPTNIYCSFILNCQSAPTNSNLMMALLGAGTNTPNNPDDPLDFYVTSSTNGPGFRVSVSHLDANTATSSKVLGLYTNHIIVVKYLYGSGGRASVFIDPTPGATEPTTASAATSYPNEGTDYTNLQVILLRSGSTLAGQGIFQMDTLRVGTTWNDVLPLPPLGISGPTDALICAGSPANFSATVFGTPPFHYQWRTNGVAIAKATNSTVSIATSINPVLFPLVDIVASDATGSITSSVVHIRASTSVPVITQTPVNQPVYVGIPSATFTVASTVDAYTGYQWRRNGIVISGATNAAYVVNNPVPADEYNFLDVVVSNPCGSVTSSPPVSVQFPHTYYPAGNTPGFFSGINFFTTNTSGLNMYTWSSTNPWAPVATWFNEGLMQEQVLSDFPGSRYSINVSPASPSLVFYIIGTSLQPPYVSPASVQWITTDEFGNSSAFTDIFPIDAAGVISNSFPRPLGITGPMDTLACAGGFVSLSVSAVGTTPFSYQWYSNGVPILGATNSSLLSGINANTNLLPAFNVVVNDANGSITSRVPVLTVSSGLPQILQQPANVVATNGITNAVFSITASVDAYTSVQWRSNGTNITGATNLSYTISNPAATDPVNMLDIVLSNPCGSVTSAPPVTLQFPHAFFFPGSTPGFFSGINFYTTNTSGLSMYTWSSSDPALPVTAWFNEGLMQEQVLTDVPGGSRYSINVIPATPLVYYVIGTTTSPAYVAPIPCNWIVTDEFGNNTSFTAYYGISANGVVDIPTPPTITQQPYSLVLLKGKTATFTAAVSGTGPLSYQWYTTAGSVTNAPGPTLLLGTNATLTITNVIAANSGNYYLIVTNAYGSVISASASLNVVAPFKINAEKSGARFKLSGTGVPGDVYTVQQNTNTTLPYVWTVADSVVADNNGLLQWIDTNTPAKTFCLYRLVSTPAVQTVPVVWSQPVSSTVIAGQGIALNYVVSGGAPLYCQWYFNSNSMGNSTNTSLILTPASPANIGSYYAVVSNAYGSVTSTVATLNVIPVPMARLKPAPAGVQITATIGAGLPYIVQMTTNLHPPVKWVNIVTNKADISGAAVFNETNTTSHIPHFYRLAFP